MDSCLRSTVRRLAENDKQQISAFICVYLRFMKLVNPLVSPEGRFEKTKPIKANLLAFSVLRSANNVKMKRNFEGMLQ